MDQGFPIHFMKHTIRYLVDGFEHRVGASANKSVEQTTYSPKKKQHSFNTLIYTLLTAKFAM
jgi:hypothetical protein